MPCDADFHAVCKLDPNFGERPCDAGLDETNIAGCNTCLIDAYIADLGKACDADFHAFGKFNLNFGERHCDAGLGETNIAGRNACLVDVYNADLGKVFKK